MTASVVTEILSLLGMIDKPLYDDLSHARKARNDWIHGLRHPKPEDAMVAHRAASQMLRAIHGVDLRTHLTLSTFSI
jgi:hypothetical protein